MTNREFYTAVSALTNIPAELTEFAAAAIVKLDAANEKRKNKPTKAQAANAPILAEIAGVLTSEGQTATDIAAKVEISTQKASALLRQLVAAGKATVTDVKVPKKGTMKAYSVVED